MNKIFLIFVFLLMPSFVQASGTCEDPSEFPPFPATGPQGGTVYNSPEGTVIQDGSPVDNYTGGWSTSIQNPQYSVGAHGIYYWYNVSGSYYSKRTFYPMSDAECPPPICEREWIEQGEDLYICQDSCTGPVENSECGAPVVVPCAGYAGENDMSWICGVPDPAHCTSGLKDEDEDGIDCGGSCSAECVLNCGEGSELQGMYVTGEPWRCVQSYQPDNYGNCESLNDYIINGQCEKHTEPYASFEEVPQPPVTDPWTQTSTMNISTSESIVDNQDGTKTKTITTTTTSTLESGVETTVTTKTDIIDSVTDELISTSTDVETTDTTKKLGEAYTVGAVQDQTKTLSNDLSKIENELGKSNDKLDYINSNIVSIKGTIENIGDQFKEELPDTFVSDIGQDLEDASNNTVDVIEAETIGAAQSGATDYGSGQMLPVAEGLTGKLNDILPDYSACTTGVSFEFVPGSPWTIGCEIWDMIKMWLGWIMYILTAYFIVDMFFSTAPK